MAKDLGEFQREFSKAKGARFDLVTAGVLFVVFAGGGAFALSHTKPEDLKLGYTFVGGILLALLAWIVWSLVKQKHAIEYHSDGLRVKLGGAPVEVRWDDVAALKGGVPVKYKNTDVHLGGPLTLILEDGREHALDGMVEDSETLYMIVNDEVVQRLLPAALAKIDAGETLAFGPFGATRQGLTYKEEALAWAALDQFSFTPDDVSVNQLVAKKPWATVRIDKVVNLNLLMEVARRLRG